METKTIDHGNGHSTTYKIGASGTAYHENTPEVVVNILDSARTNHTKLKLYYGDVVTGRDWHETMDVTGRIGRSTGNVKIPLLIATERSHGGGAILDHCIVKIRNFDTGIVLYTNPNYKAPKVDIVPSDMPEKYTHNVNVDGETYSRHKSLRSAQIMVTKVA